MHHAHMGFQALWCLPRHANGPHAAIDFAQDRFDLWLSPLLTSIFGIEHLIVLRELLTKTKTISKSLHDDMVGYRFK